MTQSPTLPWVRVHHRPVLIRAIGGLATLALASQLTAHLGIEAWLDSTLFAVASPGPEAIARGADLFAVEVGRVGYGAAIQVENVLQQAAHLKVLSMAIAWTAAAGAAVCLLRLDEKPLVLADCRRPARPVALLVPAPA